jgi:hypothetical protein
MLHCPKILLIHANKPINSGWGSGAEIIHNFLAMSDLDPKYSIRIWSSFGVRCVLGFENKNEPDLDSNILSRNFVFANKLIKSGVVQVPK